MNIVNINVTISVLMGVLLGIILYVGFFNSPVIRGPNSKNIVNKTFVFGGKRYKFVPHVCGCVNNK